MVEGPLIRLKDNADAAMVRILADGNHRCGPGDKLARLRPMEPAVEELLNRCIDLSTQAFQANYDRKKAEKELAELNHVPEHPHGRLNS